MKKKKNTYLLLALVLLIWGVLIYRVVSYTNPELPQSNAPENFTLRPLEVKEKETFSIDVNYRDPFLGKMYAPAAPTKPRQKQKVIVQVEWPSVIYKGIVSDSKDKKKVFLLIVNGRPQMMKEKETVDGILLKSGNRQSVTVKYKGDLTTIMIQE
jgi:hypothetical protein